MTDTTTIQQQAWDDVKARRLSERLNRIEETFNEKVRDSLVQRNLQRLKALAHDRIRDEGIVPLHAQGFWSLRRMKVATNENDHRTRELQIRFQANRKIIISSLAQKLNHNPNFKATVYERETNLSEGVTWRSKHGSTNLSEDDALNFITKEAQNSLKYHMRRKTWNVVKKTAVASALLGAFLWANGALSEEAGPANDVLLESEP